MANHDLEFIETLNPSTAEIDFLTEKINEESRAQNILCDAYPFGIFVQRKKHIDKEKEREVSHLYSTIVASSSSHKSASLPPTQKPKFAGQGKAELENVEQETNIVGGCNGSVIYGSIYIDQLWVDPLYRRKGLGKTLMEKVHELGKRRQCTFATVGTMDFQGAQSFYEKLGYEPEFERRGYANGGKMIYLRKELGERKQ